MHHRISLPVWGLLLIVCLALGLPAQAHNAPSSFIDLRLGAHGIDATVQASATDLTHGLPTVEPNMLMSPAVDAAQQAGLAAMLLSRFHLAANGQQLSGQFLSITPVPDRRDVRMQFRFPWAGPPRALQIYCLLFPYDPRHKTFVNIYQGGTLERQAIFSKDAPDFSYRLGSRQSVGAVIRQFVFEGIHHIFLGPDHILFIVGLLFLGGSLKQLLKIVTAFTIAHSITLALATLQIVNPSPRLIEPAIALSIVFVGIHSLTYKGKGDPRLLFAFCFGFIHGFGFANALREMHLPRYALGWSLFSFNVGVEIGQMCIVLSVAPLLALIRRRDPVVARRVVMTGSTCVILAGAFWFVQRVFFTG